MYIDIPMLASVRICVHIREEKKTEQMFQVKQTTFHWQLLDQVPLILS